MGGIVPVPTELTRGPAACEAAIEHPLRGEYRSEMARQSEPVFPDLRDDQILTIGIYGETVAAYRYDVLAE